MSPQDLKLGAEFSESNRADWEALAQKALGETPLDRLKSRTYDGLEIQPLYLAEDWPADRDPSGFPGQAPFTRGASAAGTRAGWGLEPEVAHTDPARANEVILEELQKGATGIVLRIATDGRSGVSVGSLEDMDRTLKGVLADVAPVRLKAGGGFMAAAAMMAAVWQRRGAEPGAVLGSFGADPLGSWAEAGDLRGGAETAIEAATALARHTQATWPGVTALGVDTGVYHGGGATEAQELGCALATGLAYVKALVLAGMSVDHACRQIEFTLVADENFFGTIAKMRAARMVWARLAESCGASEGARAMRLRATTAGRMMTRRDPWVNMLRTTSACFAAGVAGAEAVTVLPYNAALGLPDGFGRRIARNTQIILQEESSLNRVIDPAGGSWYVENLTELLAEAGWREFQAIEVEGGMAEALRSGKLQKRIAAAATSREKNIAKRKDAITGVSEFPYIQEAPVEIENVDAPALSVEDGLRPVQAHADSLTALDVAAWIKAAAAGAGTEALLGTLGDAAGTIRPVERRRLAESFEALRDASDAALEKAGKRPQVFLANMGRVAQHTARAMFAKNFYEAGGIEALSNDGFSSPEAAAEGFENSGARLAVICGSDPQYEDSGEAMAMALKAAGAERVILAGRPGEREAALREAGVDEFIFMGCDVLGSLRAALTQLGVMKP